MKYLICRVDGQDLTEVAGIDSDRSMEMVVETFVQDMIKMCQVMNVQINQEYVIIWHEKGDMQQRCFNVTIQDHKPQDWLDDNTTYRKRYIGQ